MCGGVRINSYGHNGLRRRDVVAGLKEWKFSNLELFSNDVGRGSLRKASTHDYWVPLAHGLTGQSLSVTSLSAAAPSFPAPEHEPRTFPEYTPPASVGEGQLRPSDLLLLKPVVLVSIVQGVGPIVPGEVERR